jgi:hypothetical protein
LDGSQPDLENYSGIELASRLAKPRQERGARIATRNVSDFDQTGVKVINPWKDVISPHK